MADWDLKLGLVMEEGQPPQHARRKRAPSSSSPAPELYCLVQGCTTDLTTSRDYHRRHRVCERHSKTPVVIVAGQEQRFCQQCSRFQLLGEFDDAKRSCRKRLEGHNRRRRKPQPEYMISSASAAPSVTPPLFQQAPEAQQMYPQMQMQMQMQMPTQMQMPMPMQMQMPMQMPSSATGWSSPSPFLPFMSNSSSSLGREHIDDCALSLLSSGALLHHPGDSATSSSAPAATHSNDGFDDPAAPSRMFPYTNWEFK